MGACKRPTESVLCLTLDMLVLSLSARLVHRRGSFRVAPSDLSNLNWPANILSGKECSGDASPLAYLQLQEKR